MNTIKIGQSKIIPVKQLAYALGNREIYDAHIGKFEGLLIDYGFMDSLKVVPADDNYLIVEGQHRFEAGQRLGMTEFPCYVIDWIEGCDEDEIQSTIISLNANNKTWTIYDFVKSFADKGDEDYKILKARMIHYRDTLSNGVVASCHNGTSRGHKAIKEGEFRNVNNDFTEWMLNRLHQVVISDGRKNYGSRMLSIFVSSVWKYKDDIKLISALIQEMRKIVASGQSIPDGELALQDWIQKMIHIIQDEQ
jgi:hypothetical protein